MELQTVEIPRGEARLAAAEYAREARVLTGERAREFAEIARAYRLAARDGVSLIALTPTLRAGGTVERTLVFGKGRDRESRERYLLPRLAVCRASAAFVYTLGVQPVYTLGVQPDGSLEYIDSLRRRFDYRSVRVRLDSGTFDEPAADFGWGRFRAEWPRGYLPASMALLAEPIAGQEAS